MPRGAVRSPRPPLLPLLVGAARLEALPDQFSAQVMSYRSRGLSMGRGPELLVPADCVAVLADEVGEQHGDNPPLVAADDDLMCAGWAELLTADPEIDIVGQASTGRQALPPAP